MIDSKEEGIECGKGWTEKRKRRKQCDYILIPKKSKYIFEMAKMSWAWDVHL